MLRRWPRAPLAPPAECGATAHDAPDARCAGRPLDSIREQLAAEDTENQRKLARLNGCAPPSHPTLALGPRPAARTLKRGAHRRRGNARRSAWGMAGGAGRVCPPPLTSPPRAPHRRRIAELGDGKRGIWSVLGQQAKSIMDPKPSAAAAVPVVLEAVVPEVVATKRVEGQFLAPSGASASAAALAAREATLKQNEATLEARKADVAAREAAVARKEAGVATREAELVERQAKHSGTTRVRLEYYTEGLWPKTYTSIHIDTHVYKSTYTVSRGKVRPSPGPGP